MEKDISDKIESIESQIRTLATAIEQISKSCKAYVYVTESIKEMQKTHNKKDFDWRENIIGLDPKLNPDLTD